MRIEGEALTADGARVMRRLCRHWGHKFEVRFDDTSGEIQLNEVQLRMRVEPQRLHLELENPAGEVPTRLCGVVADHLIRMAGAESPLPVNWSAARAIAG